MSDLEDPHFHMESWTPPQRRKRQKGPKKDKKEKKRKNTLKTDESTKKKKKAGLGLFEALAELKEKKQKKRKKQDKMEAGDGALSAQGSSDPFQLRSGSPAQLSEAKRKKTVAFGLPYDCVRVKRPKFVGESQVVVRPPTPDQDSPGTSEDLNSQDLFITQKTFRASPVQPSSGEARQVTFKESVSQERKCPGGARSSLSSPFLDHLDVVKPTQDEGPGPHLSARRPLVHPQPPLFPRTRTSSTQTENFFTAELCSYLSFCREARARLALQDLKPLDMSLPRRSPGRRPAGGKPSTPSPPSEAEHRSAETLTSSEDDHPCHKRDPIQVKGVQTKLNKPFFFKTKGEGQPARPESPLMKLSQGRDIKSRKHR
ncbi:uncharacterized protein ACNS7B_006780 isoform 1-T2 [Menidia menidia]